MKKITFILTAALMLATSGFAQTGQKRVVQLPGATKTIVKETKATPKKAYMQRQIVGSLPLRESLKKRPSTGIPKAPWQRKAVNKEITGGKYITEQPAGELVSYIRSGEAYAYTYFGPMYTSVESAVGQVVFGDNGKVFIHNIISQPSPLTYSSWIEGTLEGSTMTFELPAKTAEYGAYELYATLMKYDEAEDTYVYDPEQTTLTLNYDAATRTITTPEGSPLATGDVVVGWMWGDDETWAGMADWNMTFEVMTDESVTAPEGLETIQYSLAAEGYGGSLVNVGFDGNDIYVQGIYSNMPEAWVKGTIEGDKVVFKNGQYMGPDLVGGYHQYLVSGSAEEVYDEIWEEYYTEYSLTDNDIVFDYDASTKSLSNGSLFFVNAG